VGDVMPIEGFVVSVPTPVPIATLVTVSPFAVKLIVTLVVFVAGVKRSFTACVAPAPLSENGLPNTIANGKGTEALPVTVPPAVFDTVQVCSAKLPRFTLPKFTGPVGLTVNSLRATALAGADQALGLPLVSTALTATKYTVPVARPVSRKLTVELGAGLDVGEATETTEAPGQGDEEVP
jgi:hypothetical protein